MNLDNCKKCKEKRCTLAFLQEKEKTKEQIESEKIKKLLIKEKMTKLKNYTIREKKYWNNLKKRELALINYDRKPYMNKSDWIHDSNWYISIKKLMELDEIYYRELDKLNQELINL